jgi:hypothetical protein
VSRAPAAAIAAIVLALTPPGCGGSTTQYGALKWVDEPQLFQPKRLPDDRVLVGTVRNDGLARLTLYSSKVTVHDSTGRKIPASAGYVATFAHGLYGAFRKPDPLPPEELARLGYVVTLEAGKTSPLFVAFRLPPGAEPPFSINYGRGTLPVPERVQRESTL